MKKTITKIICTAMVLTMMFCLAGCGDSEKKKEAIDTFNKTSDSFNEVAEVVNANIDSLDETTVEAFQNMSAALNECKEKIEKSDASDEDYDVVIENLKTVNDWLESVKGELDAAVEAE